jgi:hypothetical protein
MSLSHSASFNVALINNNAHDERTRKRCKAASKRAARSWDSKSKLLFLPTFLILGQLICQLDPTELATRMYVVLGRQTVWGIKATSRDVDLIWKVFVLEG